MRCAAWRRGVGVDPIGTARVCHGVVLVEWPVPWPRDVAEVAALAEPVRVAGERGLAVQLVADPTPGDLRRVVVYRRPDPVAFAAFDRHEVAVRPDEVVDAATALAREATVAGPGVGPSVNDVLICTHGRRDVCCGSLGSTLFSELQRATRLDHAVTRVWRTSHLGGHRFAATVLILPTGTMWAFADADLVARVLGRVGPVADVLARYRGSVVLEPHQQVLERYAFAEVGWSWLDHSRRGDALRSGRIRVVGERPGSGEAIAWSAAPDAGRRLPVPDCGTDPVSASAFESEVVLRDVRRA
jgi:hypothetical protein